MIVELFFSTWVLIVGLICVLFASPIGKYMRDYRIEKAKELYKERKYIMARIIVGGSPEQLTKMNPKIIAWLSRAIGIFFIIISGLMMIAIFS
jgi:hypothetical protein